MAAPPPPTPIYRKTPRTAQETLHRLWNKGLLIDDRPAAERALSGLGYFRLLIYMRLFQLPSGSFRARTRFLDFIDLYEFDRSLRALAMDATERVEVGLRASLSNPMSVQTGDAHWFGP